MLLTLLIGLLALSTYAQEPIVTEEPAGPVLNPQATVAVPTDAGAPIVEATATVVIAPEVPILTSARSDMETLSNTLLGTTRPPGWSGSLDFTNPQLPLLIRLDLELLVGATMGADIRPAGWFGAIPSTPFAIARDIRHDLELLADEKLGLNVRPPGWIGDDPVMRCPRATQTLVSLLERAGVFVLNVVPATPNYCTQVELQAAQFAEVNLLSNPNATGANALSLPTAATEHIVNSNFAVAFLDRNAQLTVGVVPNGTPITPVARSYAQFSNMMLIRGENFEVFVDYQFTSVTDDEFEVLPDVASAAVNPSCGAEWCLAG
jgi:hypothetical protein